MNMNQVYKIIVESFFVMILIMVENVLKDSIQPLYVVYS